MDKQQQLELQIAASSKRCQVMIESYQKEQPHISWLPWLVVVIPACISIEALCIAVSL